MLSCLTLGYKKKHLNNIIIFDEILFNILDLPLNHSTVN
jgi:hypothetical protein